MASMATDDVIVLDDSADEEVAVRAVANAAAEKATSAAPPRTKKPRIAGANSVANSKSAAGKGSYSSQRSVASVTSGASDFGVVPDASSSKSSSQHHRRPQQQLQQSSHGTEGAESLDQLRRSRRSFADTLSFSELQAQQRALEYLHAVAHRKHVKKPSRSKAKTPIAATPPSEFKQLSLFSAPTLPALKPGAPTPAVPTPAAPTPVAPTPVAPTPATPTRATPTPVAPTAAHPVHRAPPPKTIPTYDSETDFEPAPARKPVASRAAPAVIPVSPVQVVNGSHAQSQHSLRVIEVRTETIDIFSDDDDFGSMCAVYEETGYIPTTSASQNGAGASQSRAKRKRKRPSNVAKKGDERKSSSSSAAKSQPAAFKPAEMAPIVSDFLPARRNILNTVIHNTSWRQCYFDKAPVNLLPSSSGDARPCLMSKIHPPLTAYDANGVLEEKCKILPMFGKTILGVSSISALDAEPGAAQAALEKKVALLVESELPRIQECYRLKTASIRHEARLQVHELLRDHQLHQENAQKRARTMHKLEVAPAERSLIHQMQVPEVLSPAEKAKLKYFVGHDETGAGEKQTPNSATRLCKFHMQSRSTTFIGIRSSIRVEDDPILRYIPYFGDNESGEEIDVKQYEKIRSQEASQRSGLDGEVNEYFLRFVVAECGDSQPVFDALKSVYGLNQAYSDYAEIKKNADAKRLTSKRIESAKSLVNEKASESEATTLAQLANLFRGTSAFGTSDPGSKSLLDRLTPPPTYFESNLARRRTDRRASSLGLRSTDKFADLSVHYRDLFCRMCYKYDCHEHGIEHPQPIRRADPINPLLRLSPVALALEKESLQEEKQETECEDEEKSPAADLSQSSVVEILSPDNSVDNIELDEESTGTDENEPAGSTSAAALDRRRSARSQTRASTMASAFLEGFPSVERSRPSRPSRAVVKTRRKVADDSEFLDDSHCAIVNDMSESESSIMKGEVQESSSIKSVLSPTELVLLQKTRDAVGDNPCMIASIVKSVSCTDLHRYLEVEKKCAPQRNGSMDESAFSPDVRASKNRKRGRNTTNNNRELLKRTRNQRMKEKGSNNEYEPCNHDGVCDSSVCSCMTRNHMCEKACSCSRDCPNRFQGCRCSMGNCRTNACPCFVAMRECNPDVCFTCGASEVPVLIYNEELQGRPAMELGICCNVNLTRAIHKKLGVSFSTTHGWGTFAREPIKRGEFIYEYKGAIISQDEAERRGSIYDKNAISFLFDANEDAVVDAIRMGNKSKFANHSNVNPKCKAKIFRVGGEHRVAIWAQQDIRLGEELFFNYGYSGESAPDWSQLRIKDSHRSTKG